VRDLLVLRARQEFLRWVQCNRIECLDELLIERAIAMKANTKQDPDLSFLQLLNDQRAGDTPNKSSVLTELPSESPAIA
jgi:hypothetical protein